MSDNFGTLLYEDGLPGGAHWSFTLRRGISLRLIDKEGDANVGMLFFNPANTLERYNAPDTLKCQHTFKLTKGNCLYSDMGRVFCSITEDSIGWHDTVSGNLTEKMVQDRWGEVTYQEGRNKRTMNGQDCFLIEAAKYGLTSRDMPMNLNFFSKVFTDADGNMAFEPENSKAGDYIDLRFEMDTLVLFHTCPHPLNPADHYPKKPIIYQFWQSHAVREDDYCRNFRPENQRGLQNTELFNACSPNLF